MFNLLAKGIPPKKNSSNLSNNTMMSRKTIMHFAALLLLSIWFTAAAVNAAPSKHYQEKKVFFKALSLVLNKYITPVENWMLFEGTVKGLDFLGGEKMLVKSETDQIQIGFAGQDTMVFSREEIDNNAIALVDTISSVFDRFFEQFPQQDKTTVIHAAISGMVSTLEPNSYFIEPEDLKILQEKNSGLFRGIGVEITIRNDKIFIVTPYEDTPAFYAGLLPKDQIVAVDGLPTSGMRTTEVAKMIRGEKGTGVTLRILREGWQSPRDITLIRDIISYQTIKSAQLEPGFGYIRIINFLGSTDIDFANALKQLNAQNQKGLIIDLRNNPGGLLDQSLGIANFLLSRGVIAKTDGRVKSDNKVYYARSSTLSSSYPIVVLINGGSASGSEVLAAALNSNKKAILIGERSFGKGFIQTIFPTLSGGAIRITTSMLLTPDGKQIQDIGINPDLNMPKPELDHELPGHDQAKLPIFAPLATKDDPAVKLGLKILKRSLQLQDASEDELKDLTPEQAAEIKLINGMQNVLQELGSQENISNEN
jgi:carboxyl-terminal processing protease